MISKQRFRSLFKPEDLTIVLAPLMLIPASIIAWYIASIFKRSDLFAWASIMQVSITAACVTFYFFGTLQSSRGSGIAAGLFAGLTIAYAGKALYKRSCQP
ncbi:MAG: hypothetical protein WC749_01100 [Dehalococcoidia bacterium]|uniref:hypothetical protein n=1 Tax=unclassified Pseudomonas TaxID=196821 RepID=UPI001475A711|nr:MULTISPECIES: hypothetical protein [unclassified Pseudomonas]NMX92468.1 hypothetical protein [Pseudomonas sp. WS 5086]NMY47033.1 hypothetical protein [Pseudomonas sp. WS 5027]